MSSDQSRAGARVVMRTSVSLTALTAALISGFPVEPSAAVPEERSATIEEVTVTARRREESLERTPVSITAFSATDIVARNIRNTSDIGRFTPNLTFDAGTGDTGGSSNAQIFIRGVGQQDFLFTTDPGVGIYVDGVYFPRALGSILDLVDIERIEVLRGPQGTLFGKNTIGGVINIVSKLPSDEFSGNVEASVGNYNRIDAHGVINLPIDEKIAAKVAMSTRNRDGLTKRTDGVELGDIDRSAAQLMLKMQASDNLTILLSADYSRQREEAINNSLLAVNDFAPVLFVWNALVAFPAFGQTWGSQFLTGDPFTSQGNGPSQSDLDLWGTSATIDWTAGDITVKSITAYRHQDAFFASDVDHSPLLYLDQLVDDKHEMFSQELQLSGAAANDKLTWLVGGFYMHEKGADFYDLKLAPGLYDALELLPGLIPGTPFGGAGNPFNVLLDIDQLHETRISIDSYAVFFHATYQVTEKLSASGGVRYSHDKKKLFASALARAANVYIVDPTNVDKSWDAFTPKGSLEYQWTDDLMTYASISRGFKSGGFNGRAMSTAEAEVPFDPEYTLAYEVGFKSMLFERRLQINGAAFYTDYNDIQLTSVTSTPQGATIVVTENAGKAKIKGFELEMLARPTPDLDLRFGVGYIDAEYTKLNPGVQTVTPDSKFVKTPKWSIDGGIQYTLALGNDANLVIRGDYSYRSRVYHTPANLSLLSQDGVGLVSARLSYESNAGWRVTLWGTNLTDETYLVNGLEALASLGTADATYGQPREYGVETAIRF